MLFEGITKKAEWSLAEKRALFGVTHGIGRDRLLLFMCRGWVLTRTPHPLIHVYRPDDVQTWSLVSVPVRKPTVNIAAREGWLESTPHMLRKHRIYRMPDILPDDIALEVSNSLLSSGRGA